MSAGRCAAAHNREQPKGKDTMSFWKKVFGGGSDAAPTAQTPQPSAAPKPAPPPQANPRGTTPRFEKEATEFSKSAIAEMIAAFQLTKSHDPTGKEKMVPVLQRMIQCGDCGQKFVMGDGMQFEYESSIRGKCLAFRCTKCGIRRFWVA